ncbi:hypothetical protein M404DRAFT_431678 [Pisolithus tinctorius Marx 270]|uniref:Uncharacterized protein n=1 Tax=Pisolithus tinctorius Marx 270 TaxID=870435 RepID=A0A0C3KC59_PISTI|nr:hypothetical protein M404DRAFT_431678 [Pisolithus tinctorius Marx 270]
MSWKTGARDPPGHAVCCPVPCRLDFNSVLLGNRGYPLRDRVVSASPSTHAKLDRVKDEPTMMQKAPPHSQICNRKEKKKLVRSIATSTDLSQIARIHDKAEDITRAQRA